LASTQKTDLPREAYGVRRRLLASAARDRTIEITWCSKGSWSPRTTSRTWSARDGSGFAGHLAFCVWGSGRCQGFLPRPRSICGLACSTGSLGGRSGCLGADCSFAMVSVCPARPRKWYVLVRLSTDTTYLKRPARSGQNGRPTPTTGVRSSALSIMRMSPLSSLMAASKSRIPGPPAAKNL